MLREACGDGLIVAKVVHGDDEGFADRREASIDFRRDDHRSAEEEQGGQASRHVSPFRVIGRVESLIGF
jgi:hypothetical protein